MHFLQFACAAPVLLWGASAILNCTAGAAAPNGLLLFDFRSASVEGWKIGGASLLLHLRDGNSPRTLRVSSIPVGWTETVAEKAAATAFRKPAIFGAYPVTPAGQGWISVELDPAIVEAMASGRAFGLAIDPAGVKLDGARPVFTQPHIRATGR